jgi:hypothetical protein
MRGITSHCATTSTMAAQLGLGPGVCDPPRQFFTRWDGQGVPAGVGGEQIAATVRLIHVADVVEVHHRADGVRAAVRWLAHGAAGTSTPTWWTCSAGPPARFSATERIRRISRT